MVFGNICLYILKFVIIVYTIATLPIYFIIQMPWKQWKKNKIIWGKHSIPGDPSSPVVRNTKCPYNPMEKIKTLDELFRTAASKNPVGRCLGKREVISVVHEGEGAVKKLQLGDYQWLSYNEVNCKIEAMANGFLSVGFQPGKQVVLYAETRMEWILVLYACVRINVPVVTLYATLGENALIHGLNETEVFTVVTSQERLPNLEIILDKVPNVRQIIVMEDVASFKQNKVKVDITYFKFSDIELIGHVKETASMPLPPQESDVCLIMYTSGSADFPKGVILTHKDVINALLRLHDALPEVTEIGLEYIAFLPLAHIVELLAESFTLSNGHAIGYSSPFTFMDKSLGLANGCKGDISILRPNFIVAVPLLLDRIRKGINENVSSKGEFAKKVFDFFIKYKQFWCARGYKTPILNSLAFRKMKGILGGNVKLIVSGSATLSCDTCHFIKTCLDVRLVEAYGLVETTGPATAMSYEDNRIGTVGPPCIGYYLKLVDWEEGGYKSTDKPCPRGEIVIGGSTISSGYYKNETLTEQCYKEENGMKWFYTGDIGELCNNGTLKIIDRKKDLFKLQGGEYVSLGKIESEMKTSALVNNICVIGNPYYNYLIAIIVPNPLHLQVISDKAIFGQKLVFYEQCSNEIVINAVTKLLIAHAEVYGLNHLETPQKFHLCTDIWLPETGLVTAGFKIRRKYVEQYYKSVIDKMFRDDVIEKTTISEEF